VGFRLDRKYVLEFEGAMEGAHVKLKSTPVGVAMEMRGGETSAVGVERVAELLAEYVEEWNLDGPDGETLPITKAAILTGLEVVVIAKIAVEWYKAAVGVTAPLDPPGADGTLSDEDIPMEPATA
jgi:hypothetical protein